MATSSNNESMLGTRAIASGAPTAYREAEARLWGYYGATPAERVVTVPSLQSWVRVQEVGEGAPVLFIHGGPNAGTTFASLAAALRGRRCLVLDRPGCGLSGPVDYDRMSLPRLAAAVVAATLDELGIEALDLVGSSFGGSWAMWFALAHPDRVRRLMLLGAPAFVPSMAVPQFMRMMLTPVIGKLIASMPPSVSGSKWVYQQMGHRKAAADSVIPQVYWEWSVRLLADTPTMASDLRAIHKTITRRGSRPEIEFTPDHFRAVAAPTLLYWGDADTFGGTDVARAMADLLPDCAVEIVPGAGHLPWLDDPAHAASSVAEFLGGAEGDAPGRSNAATAGESTSGEVGLRAG